MLPLALGRKLAPLPGVKGPALENASGDDIQSKGEVHAVDFVTGTKVLPGRLTAAGVVQPILSAHDYSGEEGEFETLLRPPSTFRLTHLPTGEVFPLKWEDGTLKLAKATCAPEKAKRVPARLPATAAARVAAVPATLRVAAANAKPATEAAAQGSRPAEAK